MSPRKKAFWTTIEVTAAVGVEKRTIAFWESRFAFLRPMRDGAGRRRWSEGDIALLRGIQHLLHVDGHTIRGVQKLIRARGIETVREIGRGEASIEVAPAPERRAEACFVLTHLPERARAALVAALSDPARCRALADQCLGQEKAA